MDQTAYLEYNASQKPAIELLQSMGYTYISPEDSEKQRGSKYHVLLKDILRGQLRKLNRYAYAGAENEFSAANIERAMEELDEPLIDGLVRTSEKIYDALLLGKSYPETVGGGKSLSFNMKYIDWEHPENNLYHVTEEFAVEILKHFQLYAYFAEVGGASMDEKRTDKADVISYVLEKAHVKERSKVVMVGDRKHDIIGAKKNGLDSIGVLYGYGDYEELEKAGATYIAEKPEDLLNLV